MRLACETRQFREPQVNGSRFQTGSLSRSLNQVQVVMTESVQYLQVC